VNTTLTLEEVFELPLERREFLQGELIAPPAPEPSHQDSAFRIAYAVQTHLFTNPAGRMFLAPLDVVIAGEATQPDFIFVATDQLEIIKEKRIEGVPKWLVEIVSPTSHRRDFETKKTLYLENGVEEYWVVSPEGRVIWVFRPTDLEGKVHGAGTLSPVVLPDLKLEVAKIF
jgi:Uma2 family endonuclease